MYKYTFAVHYVHPKRGIAMDIFFFVEADNVRIAFDKAQQKEYILREENPFLQKSMSTVLRFERREEL